MEYNSERGPLELREYGRNVHKLAAHVVKIEDREERTQAANVLINLMRQLNPNTGENPESTQRLWDHLHQMTGFTLDIDSEFPAPDPEVLHKKPQRIDPTRTPLMYRHYGRNLQRLIDRAAALEPGSEEQIDAVAYIGRLMKSFYSKNKKDSITDESVLKEIVKMSKGAITVSPETVKELRLFELSGQQHPPMPHQHPPQAQPQHERERQRGSGNNRRRGRRRNRH